MSGLVIAGGTVVQPGEGLLRADIAVRDGRIVGVGPDLRGSFPEARVIDASGMYVVPGLIDTHVHLGGSAGLARSPEEFTSEQFELNLLSYLRFGVTAVLEMGGMLHLVRHWQELARLGELRSPRLFAVGPAFTAPGGHPASTIFRDFPQEAVGMLARQVDDPIAAREEVAELAEAGVDAIKIIYDDGEGRFPKLRYEALRAIVEEAHRHGLKAFVHIGSVGDALDAVEAGADCLEHMVTEGDPGAVRRLMEAVAAAGTLYTPTLSVYGAMAELADERDLPWGGAERAASPALLRGLSDPAARKAFRERRELFNGKLRNALENTRIAIEAEVRIAAGTDAGNPAVFHGYSLHRELELLLMAGLSPGGALAAATAGAAAKLGREELGTIAPGAAADLLVVPANPMDDPTALRRPRWVILDGVAYAAGELWESGGGEDVS